MFRKLRIARRLTLLVVGGAGLVLGGTAIQSTFLAQHLLEEELEGKARAIAVATANQIATVERAVAVAADGLTATLEELAPSTERVVPLIESVLRRCPRAYGSALALDPSLPEARIAPYVYRSGGDLVSMNLAEGEYNYEIWDWFVLPRELRQPVWTEPYFDEGAGNILMATYAVPLLRRADTEGFWGVVTCDLSLEWLSELLESLPLGQSGYAFLISPAAVSSPTLRKST